MKNLVYCEYKENTADTVTYLYGGDYEDITGLVVFHFEEDVIEIAKEPDVEPAPMRHIKRLYGIQREFQKGNI